MNMNSIKAIMFDCFGVLYPQAAGAFFNVHAAEFARQPKVLDDLNMKIDLGQISRAEFFNGLEKVSNIPAQAIQHEIDHQLVPDERLVAHMRQLKTRYKIGLLSNAGRE